MKSVRTSLKRRWNLTVIVASLVLVGFIGFLVVENYLSQLELQGYTLEQLKQDTEKRATAVTYFSSERKNDLRNLALSRETSIFFENKALGMSMEYGLKASLLAMSDGFHRLLKEKKLGDDRIYTRIVFIDSNGELLVDTQAPDAKPKLKEDWKRFLSPKSSESALANEYVDDSLKMKASIPFFFKNRYAGQIVAWVSPETAYKHLIKAEGSSRRVIYVDYGAVHLQFPRDALSKNNYSSLPDLSNLEIGKTHRFKIVSKKGNKVEMLAIRVPIKETQSFLVAILPASEVFGQTAPWQLPLAMGALSLAILSGMVIALRINARNLVLHARLEESSNRKQEIEEKNLQLQNEVSERKRAEEALRRTQDELEIRVEERTTELVRVNEALLNAAQQWRTTFDGISDIVCLLDREGRILRCNKAMTELFKKPFSEIIGRSHWEIVHGTTAPIKECPVELMRETRCRETTTLLIDNRWFNVAVDPLLDEAGGLIGAVHIMSDVTDHKRAEEALRESEDRYRDLVEYSQYLILTHNLEGQILSVNQEGAKILGYKQRDLLNKKITDLLPIEVRNEFDTYLDTIRKDGAAKGLMLVHTASGEKRIWEYNNTLRTEGVTAPIVRSIAHDVTDRLRIEKAVKGLAQENAIMAEIGRIISSTLNIEEVYEHFTEEVRKLIPSDRIVINVIDIEKGTVSNVYMSGKGIVDREVGKILLLEGSGNAEMVRTKSTFLIQTEDPNKFKDRFPTLLSTFQAGFRSIMNVPLFSKGQVIGGLLLRSLKPYAYTDKDVKLAERIGNQIAGAIANAQLFIERKQADEALRTEKEKLQTVSENAPFGMTMIDQNGTYKYINPKFKEIFGYDLDDIPNGKAWFRKAFPDPIYRHHVISAWINDNRLGSHKPGEKTIRTFRVTCKDGTEKIIEFFPVQLETGESLTSFTDITLRKEAEEALQRSEEAATRLAQENATMAEIGQIISSSLDINDVYERFAEKVRELMPLDRITIHIFNPTDNTLLNAYVTGLNVAHHSKGEVISISGIFAEKTVRTRTTMLIHIGELEKVKDTFPELLPNFQAGIRSLIAIPLISKDEVIGVLHIESCKLKAYSEKDLRLAEGVGNQIAGAIANAQLFNERLRSEEKMKTLEDQLRQAQKMEAIGRLAGGVAHDFNNLLTVIKGYSQISLVMLKEGDPLKENVEEIQNAAHRAASLTKQLLVFSRRQILELKVFHLNPILQDLDKMLHRIIGEDIELAYLLSNNLGQVKTDPTQMEQVILNLAINAKDAMPSGGKLTIETSNATLDKNYTDSHIGVTPGDYVMLSVSDTGVGMTPEIKERIYEPFFTTKEKGKGTGLGLSIVYGIVQQSGGSIWVYSELGLGTTFKIFLPRIEEDAESLRPTAVPIKSLQGSETILVVEDEEIVRKLACKILEKNGYRVLEASNGEEALHIVQKQNGNRIHLVVTDVVMPKMSGRQLIDRLVSLWPQTKALYMSGYTNDAIVRHGVLDPGIAYIQKPFTPDDLILKVRKVLDGT